MLDEEAEGEIGDIKVQVYKVKSRTSDRVLKAGQKGSADRKLS